MKKEPILLLTYLRDGCVIDAVSDFGNKYIFLIISVNHNEKEKETILKLVEINEEFTPWEMILPTSANLEQVFVSIHDSSHVFKFFSTRHTGKELNRVLIKHIRSTE